LVQRILAVALAVLGSNAFFFIHALDIRPYAIAMLAAAISMWAFQRWLEGERRASPCLWRDGGLMLFVTTTAFLVLAQGVAFVLQRPSRG
jgi:hypothetical protein